MTIARRASAVVVLTLIATPARADTAADAETAFQEGRTLFSAGKFAEACERFAKSEQLDPAVGTLLNLGDCYKRIGKTASAWTAYRDAIRLAKDRNDEKRGALATSEAEQIEPKLARVKIEVAAKGPETSVTLNGEAIEGSSIGTATPVDPGPQTVVATAPERLKWTTTVDATAGNTKTITVPELEPIKAPGNPLATWLEIGGGVVLAGSLVFGGLALSKWSSVGDTCPERHCPDADALKEQTSQKDSAQTFAHVSTAMAAVGLVALGVGLYLDLTSSKKVSLGLAGSNAVLRLQWR